MSPPEPALTSMNALFGSSPRVLVADDEPVNRVLLGRVLMRTCQVTEAADGTQALNLLENEPFDLALLDIMMPGLTGLEVLEHMRASPRMADVPVILISALSDTRDVVRGLKLGANDYIGKPFDIDVVSARVDTHIKLKRMMDIQKQAVAQLEAVQQMKDRLFRIASHDLKSPLANVRMAEALLRGFVNDDPTALDILDTLNSTVRHMNGVIEEFLDVAAFQSAGIDIHLEPVPVRETIMNVLAQYSMAAEKKDIALEVGDLPGVALVDPARLAQVLTNLLSNALKYSPAHTTVTIWSQDHNQRVSIFIADQGPGIPVDERARLFTEFGKLSNRPTGGESSTGLGLWIVKHIVNLQNGSVGVECPPEGGSIFWVEFPAAAS